MTNQSLLHHKNIRLARLAWPILLQNLLELRFTDDSELLAVHALNQNMKLHIVHLIHSIGSALNLQGIIMTKALKILTQSLCCTAGESDNHDFIFPWVLLLSLPALERPFLPLCTTNRKWQNTNAINRKPPRHPNIRPVTSLLLNYAMEFKGQTKINNSSLTESSLPHWNWNWFVPNLFHNTLKYEEHLKSVMHIQRLWHSYFLSSF